MCLKEGTQAQEKSQTTTPEQASWWIPSDPVTERRLVAVLVEMAKCVLAHTEERSNSHQLEPEEPPPLPYIKPPAGEVLVLNLLHPADGDGAP